MPKLFGVDIAKLVNTYIGPGLQSGTLIKQTSVMDDAQATQQTITTTSHTCKLVESKNKQDFIARGLLISQYKMFVIIANSISPVAVPEPGDKLTYSGQTLWIAKGGVETDPAEATYTVVCRI